METFTKLVTVVLILAYTGVAIRVICTRSTFTTTAVSAAGFMCGCLVVIPLAQAIASLISGVLLIVLIIGIICIIFS